VCDREFFIGDPAIMPNKTLQHLIEMLCCQLNTKEKQIPRSMEERVRVFNKFSDDYEKAKNELASFSFSNFNKNNFQILQIYATNNGENHSLH